MANKDSVFDPNVCPVTGLHMNSVEYHRHNFREIGDDHFRALPVDEQFDLCHKINKASDALKKDREEEELREKRYSLGFFFIFLIFIAALFNSIALTWVFTFFAFLCFLPKTTLVITGITLITFYSLYKGYVG